MSYQKRKPTYPISNNLRKYIKNYSRQMDLPILYNDLLNYQQGFVVYDKHDKDTLWETVIYSQTETKEIHLGLTEIYIKLLSDGQMINNEHLTVDKIDYCTFGNSKPFRVKIINKINDNYDYFYVKQADASRVYGLELEDILSPNKVNYLIYKNTLIEEHIVGIPGDQFIENELITNDYNKVRLAKEFVKFNERCYIRLLGDMRSYNYVVNVTPDFDQNQFRIRAIDFDQQSYEGRRSFYFPHYFKENLAFVKMGMDCLTVESVEQYKREERSFIVKRIRNEKIQLQQLLNIMKTEKLSTKKHLEELKNEMATKEKNMIFKTANSMGELVVMMLNNLLKDINI